MGTTRMRMLPAEYLKAKDALGLTHEQIGEELGYSRRTSYRYAYGNTRIPKAVCLTLRAMLALFHKQGDKG